MAKKKSGGSTSLGRDSQSKRLGIKLQDGQIAKAGAIIVRQRGTKYRAGDNVGTGNDHTLFATTEGLVKFRTKKIRRFNDQLKTTKIVEIATENN